MDQTFIHVKDFDWLLGCSLEGLYFKKESYYKIKCSNKDGPWTYARTIPRSFLTLHQEKIDRVSLSFSGAAHVSLSCINYKVIITHCDKEIAVESESLEFTCETSIPVRGFEVSKIDEHSCYGDYLINIRKIVNGNGFLGYSFHFSSQDNIYVTPIESDYLLLGHMKPNGYDWYS